MRPSQAAFRHSVDTLAALAGEGGLYLWTFTFRQVLSVPDASRRWAKLARVLVRKYGVRGLRVYELHENHGVHVHCIIDACVRVRGLRPHALDLGFGRIHVCRVHDVENCGGYVGKYLSKDVAERQPCMRGKRLWGKMGDWAHTRVASVRVVSTLAECLTVARKWTAGIVSESATLARGASGQGVRFKGLAWDSLLALGRRMAWANIAREDWLAPLRAMVPGLHGNDVASLAWGAPVRAVAPVLPTAWQRGTEGRDYGQDVSASFWARFYAVTGRYQRAAVPA